MVIFQLDDPDLLPLVAPLLPTVRNLLTCDFEGLRRRKPTGTSGANREEEEEEEDEEDEEDEEEEEKEE
ncbi:hypothetical protein B9Z55_026037 [Caenorhabditis nigoni]|uniref:Uncharacterized protein n=1 Tax=Caenorhabditis nigoni TaxID=1611254 RepID=A0A2G5T1B1_9PELO|nr:hypothetical protein B9Z55_026037 [Caenorhabditis nigoni]